MISRLSILACALIASAAPAADPDSSGGGWRCERMDVVIDLTRAEAGRARVEGRMTVSLGLDSSMGPTIGVNWRNPVMSFVSVEGPEGAASELNMPLPISEHVKAAHVRAEAPYMKGERIDLAFMLESGDNAFQWVVREDIALASWTEAWLPAMLPAPGAPPAVENLHSSGRTTFLLPRGWSAVTNGRLIERTETESGATEVWETEQRVARSFAAGPHRHAWHDVDGRSIGVYLLEEKPMGVEKQVALLAAALAAQEARFGPYPYPTYAIVEVPKDAVQWYASSEQGFIMAHSGAFEYEHGNLPLWGHEMAHGWWGNLIGGDGPGAILCTESLAQYSAVIAIEAIEGEDAATEFLRFSREGYSSAQCAKGYFAMARQGHDMPLSRMSRENSWEHNLSDAKGHWVYHMLRGRIGDEAFFGALRRIVETRAGASMTLDDLRAAFIEAAPDAGLEAFFAQWLDRPGAPVLDAVCEGGEVVITQAQSGEPYALTIDVALETESGEMRRRTIEIAGRETRIPAWTDLPVTAIHLDPDHRLLIWTPKYGERPE